MERRSNGDCEGMMVIVEVVLVLLVEEDAVVDVMVFGSDTMKDY